VLDIPNARSSHDAPVPRGGGIGILAGLVAGSAIAAAAGLSLPNCEIIVGVGLMVVLGWADDFRKGLPVGWRLIVEILAAAIVVQGLGPLQRLPLPFPFDFPLGLLAWPLTILWIVGVVNIFNFLDGIDGFAGVQGVVAGLGLAVVGWGSWAAPLGVAVAAACAGFLVHNWHPAKVFMGDVGSLTLGFLLAVMPLAAGRGHAPQLVFVAALCLWFFLTDGAFTIVRRLSRREKLWNAHRSHLYQRLVIAGWTHPKVVLWVGVGMIAVAAAAVGAAFCGRPSALWCAFGFGVVAFVLYWGGVVLVERRGSVTRSADGGGARE
jgi:UDP-N-acetylmuramyl pentapeptide phosphotransferase/UDP-N-acetylglucosamine-1-phosphate transferase